MSMSARYVGPNDLEGEPTVYFDWKGLASAFREGMHAGVIIGQDLEVDGRKCKKAEYFLGLPVEYSGEGFHVSEEAYDSAVPAALAELKKQGKDCEVIGQFHFHDESLEPSVKDAEVLFKNKDGWLSVIMMRPEDPGALGHMRVLQRVHEEKRDEVREARYALA